MNPYNQRKEPTFGKPLVAEVEVVKEPQIEADKMAENAIAQNIEHLETEKVGKPKVALSLHTKNAPNYTFTPVMKRPVESEQTLSTLEEKAEQAMLNEKVSSNESTSSTTTGKPNGGFTFAPIVEEEAAVEPESVAPVTPISKEPVTATNPTERVIPTATKAVVEKVPSKYRRLMIVVLLLILVALAIFLLKPKTPESVDVLQEQGSSLPIEFRPVDEEEAKRAESQEKALQEVQQKSESEQQAMQISGSNEQVNQASSTEQTVQTNSSMSVVPENVVSQEDVIEQVPVAVKPVVNKPTITVVKKPETSVIYQPETAPKAVKTATKEVHQKASQAKPQVHTQPKIEVSKPTPVVKMAPVQVTSAPSAVTSKTLTVPKGVSLMQVFRNHNLNISDVNAMSKANGIVSNLKVGEKVTVHLDSNNRVAEMRIGSGGKFIRQGNGSYIYK